MDKNLIAHELKQMGFSTHIKNGGGVIVGLKSRFLWIGEVEMALDQVFESISFKLSRIDSQKVMVSV